MKQRVITNLPALCGAGKMVYDTHVYSIDIFKLYSLKTMYNN